MKKKVIILSILGMVLVSSLMIALVAKNNTKTFMQDGVLFALTVNGESRTTFPDGAENGIYTVKVGCKNARGIWLRDEDDSKWKLVIEDVTGKVSCYLDFKDRTDLDKIKNVVEAKATTNANGYRYSGKNPDNYVWFNNEMWRIIGSIPTCTSSGCTTSENLVKIIRAESIGGLAYDAKSSGYTGAWGSNTLYSLLNTHYYASNSENMNGQSHAGCYGYRSTAKANCDYSEIGIDANSYYGKMVKNVYWNTGASSDSVTAGAAYTNEIATQTVSGYIGLMSASDYGYAADSSYHSTSMGSYNTAAITGTDWLYGQGYEWTNIQYSSNASNALYVYSNGTVDSGSAGGGYSVRPVLYLDSSVYVISGEGTQASPYMIGM